MIRFEALENKSRDICEDINKKFKCGNMLNLDKTDIINWPYGRILVFGMNPAEEKSDEDKREDAHEPYLFYVPEEPDVLKTLSVTEKKKMCDNPKMMNKGYFGANYMLFPRDEQCSKVRMVWQDPKYYDDVKDTEKLSGLMKINETLEEWTEKAPYLIFSDLVFVKKTKMNEVVDTNFNKNEQLHKKIFEFFELQIEYYQPRMVIITNARASRLIYQKITGKNPDEENELKSQLSYRSKDGKIPIIFSSMVSGQRALDIFNRERLKKEIREVGEEMKLW
jgi:hypothetical protein